MTLKNVVQIAVLAVIGFALGMAVGLLTMFMGVVALYISSGLSALAVGPAFVIMARKIRKRGAAFLFWVIYGLLHAAMGYWIMIPVYLVAGLLSEWIIGGYDNPLRIGFSFGVSMFLVSLLPIALVKIIGAQSIANLHTGFTPERASMIFAAYTWQVILISILVNIVLVALGAWLGILINDKFFEKKKKQSILE